MSYYESAGVIRVRQVIGSHMKEKRGDRSSVAVAPANFRLKPEPEAAPIRASRAAFSQAAILAGSH